MKVIVTGGGANKHGPNMTSSLELLGQALAESGHELIALSHDEDHSDRHVVSGISKFCTAQTPPRRATVFVTQADPKDPEKTGEFRGGNAFPNIDFKPITTKRKYPINRVEAVTHADIVISVAGGVNAQDLCEIARLLKKGVLPIPWFDGTGKEYWTELKALYERVLSDSEFGAVDKSTPPITLANAKEIVRVAEKIERESRKEPLRLGLLIALQAVCIPLWVVLHKSHGAVDADFLMFGMLLLTSLLGILARVLIRAFSDARYIPEGREFIVEGALGALLAFVFFLLYLMGGNALTGDISAEIGKKDVFRRVDIVVSIMGFGVAFLLEHSIAQLGDKLKKQIFR